MGKAKKKTDNEINLLHRALRVAAVEAYQNEIVDTEMFNLTIGSKREFPTVKDWINYRIDTWLQQAELNQ